MRNGIAGCADYDKRKLMFTGFQLGQTGCRDMKRMRIEPIVGGMLIHRLFAIRKLNRRAGSGNHRDLDIGCSGEEDVIGNTELGCHLLRLADGSANRL